MFFMNRVVNEILFYYHWTLKRPLIGLNGLICLIYWSDLVLVKGTVGGLDYFIIVLQQKC